MEDTFARARSTRPKAAARPNARVTIGYFVYNHASCSVYTILV